MLGSLLAVGCGIVAPAHVTSEARVAIARADRVFTLAADPIAATWIAGLNPNVFSLVDLYAQGKPRKQTYREMAETIAQAVRAGDHVCAVAYGHPGVFAEPLHAAIQLVRDFGGTAQMLPGISADACLYAELGIDPARTGTYSLEATDFLIHDRTIDPCATGILWQIGIIGERGYRPPPRSANIAGIVALVERLQESYDEHHEVIVYEAAQMVISDSIVHRTPLDRLATAPITTLSTLVIPPGRKRVMNRAMYERLDSA